MPHRCTNCTKVLEDGSEYITEGCPECGNKKFQLIREKNSKSLQRLDRDDFEPEEDEDFTAVEDPEEVEEELMRQFEQIRVEEPGVYRININAIGEDDDEVNVISVGDGGEYHVQFN